MDLAIGAADGDDLPLLAALSRQWHAAVDAGHGRAPTAGVLDAQGPGGQTLPAVQPVAGTVAKTRRRLARV